jgi:hypothetical protein
MLRSSFALVVLVAACRDGGVVAFEPGGSTHFVVAALQMPTNNTQARAFGLDLNGDGTVDNQLGSVFGSFADMGFAIQPPIDAAIAEGNIDMLVEVSQSAEQGGFGAIGAVRVFFGANPQPPACNSGETYGCNASTPPICSGCGHHLGGNATFAIDPSSPTHDALVGTVTNGTLLAGPGALSLQLASADTDVIVLDLVGARASVALDASGVPTGTMNLCGGVTQDQLNSRIFPQVVRALNGIVLRDCCGAPTSPGGATCNPASTGANPNCGCIDNTSGKTMIGLFDTSPHDCVIGLDELTQNSLVLSLAAPDITIGGVLATSLGVQVRVVGATFTAP